MDSAYTVTTRLLHQLNDHVAAVDSNASDQEALAQIRGHSSIRRLQACLILLEGGQGATMTAAITRSLLASAQQVIWETNNDPRPSRPLVASLAQERRRIIELTFKHGLSVPNINRWLQPIDLPQLEDIPDSVSFPPDRVWMDPGSGAPVTARALGMTAAIAQILDMAGHANAAGSWCTVANPPHPVGYTATATYAAIFLQSASRSAAFATGLDQAPTITRTIDEITRRARSIHELPAPSQSTSPAASILSISGSPTDAADRVPFFGYPPPEVDHLLEEVLKATDAFMALLEDAPDPYVGAGPSNLRSLLPYLTALDTANTVHMAVRGYLPQEVAPIGARMLLEAAGRSAWMSSSSSSVPSDEELMLRYIAVADDETARRATLRRNLTDDAIPAHVIAALSGPTTSRSGPGCRSSSNARTPEVTSTGTPV